MQIICIIRGFCINIGMLALFQVSLVFLEYPMSGKFNSKRIFNNNHRNRGNQRYNRNQRDRETISYHVFTVQ